MIARLLRMLAYRILLSQRSGSVPVIRIGKTHPPTALEER